MSLRYLRTDMDILPNGTRSEHIYIDNTGHEHIGKMEESLSSQEILYDSKLSIGGRHATVRIEVTDGKEFSSFKRKLKGKTHLGMIKEIAGFLNGIKSRYGV